MNDWYNNQIAEEIMNSGEKLYSEPAKDLIEELRNFHHDGAADRILQLIETGDELVRYLLFVAPSTKTLEIISKWHKVSR